MTFYFNHLREFQERALDLLRELILQEETFYYYVEPRRALSLRLAIVTIGLVVDKLVSACQLAISERENVISSSGITS